MKVLCIDTPLYKDVAPLPPGEMVPVEGEIYTVTSEYRWCGLKMYRLLEFGVSGYETCLFVPVSEIDETELVNEKEELLHV